MARGGDFNFEVEELDQTGFVGKLGALPAVPPAGQITCVVQGTSRCLDYFLASPALAAGISRVAAREECPCSPHRPVVLTFAPGVQVMQFRGVARQPKVPTRPVVGPLPMPANYGRADGHSSQAEALAAEGFIGLARDALDRA